MSSFPAVHVGTMPGEQARGSSLQCVGLSVTLWDVDNNWLALGQDINDRAGLVEGVPVWVAAGIYEWIEEACYTVTGSSRGSGLLAKEFDSLSRNSWPLYSPKESPWGTLQARKSGDLTLRFIDYMLAKLGQLSEHGDYPEKLESVLALGGSAWRVGARGEYIALERRISEGTQIAAEAVISSAGLAGSILHEAWRATYGRSPDPEESYGKSIKAVEQASVPVVVPKDKDATLGKVIAALRNQADWALAVVGNDGAHSYALVADMCAALWRGQPSRHGANGYRKPTQEEAEAAVLLAVPLVQWFSTGQIARRPAGGSPGPVA